MKFDQQLWDFKFYDDGKKVIGVSFQKLIILDLENNETFTSKEIFPELNYYSNYCITLSPDEKHSFIYQNKSIYYWDIDKREIISKIQVKDHIMHIAISPGLSAPHKSYAVITHQDAAKIYSKKDFLKLFEAPCK